MMTEARLVKGWRTGEIERVYDLAANDDNYYFDDTRKFASHQKDYRRQWAAEYRKKHPLYERNRPDKKPGSPEYELKKDANFYLKYLFKLKLGVDPWNCKERHCRLRRPKLTPEREAEVRAYLISKGKLRDDANNS